MYDPTVAIWLLLGTFVLFILIKMPVTFALAVSSCITLVYVHIPLMAFIQQMGKSINSFSLMAKLWVPVEFLTVFCRLQMRL